MIEYADIREQLILWLRGKLEAYQGEVATGVKVAASVPESRIDDSPLVVLRRIGGTVTWPVLDTSTIDFLCWHKSEYDAERLAQVVRSILIYELPGTMLGGHTFYQPKEFSGPSAYPDPAGSTIKITMFTLEIPVRVKEVPDE